MGKTSIEWCDHSINPIRARLKSSSVIGHYCEKVAQGCTHCYASELQRRFQMPSFGSGQKRNDVEIFLDEKKLDEVRRRKKPTRYFWCDMTDIFGDWMIPALINPCFDTMAATPQHTHLLLTKRPENVRQMWPAAGFPDPIGRRLYLDNVWIGASIATQADADRNLPLLAKCRDLCPVRFVSAEPLLGPVVLDTLGRGGPPRYLTREVDHPEDAPVDWVIIGGESGPHARPCNVDWIRSLVRQCSAAGVPCFVKQIGAHVLDDRSVGDRHSNISDKECWPAGRETKVDLTGRVFLSDKKGGDMAEWPQDLQIREFPNVVRVDQSKRPVHVSSPVD